MAKVGYVFVAGSAEDYESDREWMRRYGCIQIVEEESNFWKTRPAWKQLVKRLDRGDVLVVSKFSNALRSARELSTFVEFCRVKVVRLISINDRIDSYGELFPETTACEVLSMIGSMPEESAAARRASGHVLGLKMNVRYKDTSDGLTPARKRMMARNKIVVDMYRLGHSIDEIWAASGFKSRGSIFRVLNEAGVELTRGPHRGPMGPRKGKNKKQAEETEL